MPAPVNSPAPTAADRPSVVRRRPDGLAGVDLHLGYRDRSVVHGADLRGGRGRG